MIVHADSGKPVGRSRGGDGHGRYPFLQQQGDHGFRIAERRGKDQAIDPGFDQPQRDIRFMVVGLTAGSVKG